MKLNHRELNKWAELYGVKKMFHWWTFKSTKRKVLIKTIKGKG